MSAVNQRTVNYPWYQRILLKIAKYQKDHWFISLFLVRLSAVWFSLVLTYAGEQLGLLEISNKGKALTIQGWVATIAMVSIILLFEASKSFHSRITEEPYEIGGFLFLNSLRKGIGTLCDSKLNTLTAQIECVKKDNVIAPVIVSNPQKQLQAIADQIKECLSQLLAEKGDNKVNGKDIVATIAYQFPLESDKWYWATEEHGLGFDKLVTSSAPYSLRKSTFQSLLESGHNYLFYNSKQEAFQDKKYICDDFDERDENDLLKGSIACYKIEIKKNDKVYIRSVLSITSYKQHFTSDTSKQTVNNVRWNMDDFVINDFSKRIKIELCLLYLSILQKQHNNEKAESASE